MVAIDAPNIISRKLHPFIDEQMRSSVHGVNGVDNEPFIRQTRPVEATPWATFGAVVGENVRRLREAAGLTQTEAARLLQATGFPSWTRSQIAALEAGNRESVDAGTLVMLATAFSVRVSDLFAGDGGVLFSDEVGLTREMLRYAYSGGDELGKAGWTRTGRALASWIEMYASGAISIEDAPAPFQADAELAVRLGISPNAVIDTARNLWGRTLHEERDHRVSQLGEIPSAERRARRGHVTRQLAKEIEEALSDTSRGGDRE